MPFLFFYYVFFWPSYHFLSYYSGLESMGEKHYMSFELSILTNSRSLDGLWYGSRSLEKGRVLFALFASLCPKDLGSKTFLLRVL